MAISFDTSRAMTAVVVAVCAVICTTGLAQTNDAVKQRTPEAVEPTAELAERIDRLIEQLGDPRFTVRERAQQELTEIGGAAFDALTAAQGHIDPEIAARARLLVQSIRMEWSRDSDSADVTKLLADYESQTDQERRRRIALLAAKSQAEGLAPLCRVVRFERSVLLSKQAAVAVMDQKRPPASAWTERSRIILDETRRSKRQSALWLRAYADFPNKPEETLAAWKGLLVDEEQRLNAQPSAEQRAVLAGLLRQQVIMLLEQQQQDESLLAMRRMLDVDKGDSQSLAELVEWVIRQEAWPLVDEVAKRLDRQLSGDPYLMYLVARAYELRGDSERAEKLANLAIEQQAATNVDHHFTMGYRLQQQGMMKWAEREYRVAIDSEAEGNFDDLAYGMLGELLGDQQRYGEAADVLERLVKKMAKVPRGRRNRGAFNRNADQVQARMHFFRGKQYAMEKQTDKQVEHLDAALKYDPTEADVLIALYRVENLKKEKREIVIETINRAAMLFEQRLTASPDDATAMNQFAWLVGNTEGDTDKAIRLSQRSVELAGPEQLGGYLDTLAHCYAAKNDFETAFKHQTRAAELEPHSGEIKRALERFKRQRDEQAATEK